MARTCSRCGNPNPDEATFCNKCGRKVLVETPQTTTCPSCGKQTQSDFMFCGHCGSELRRIVATETQSSGTSTGYHGAGTVFEDDDFGPRALSGTLLAGAVMTLLCGLLSLGSGVLIVLMGDYIGSFDAGVGNEVVLCGAAILVLGLVATAGSVYAFRASNFAIALVGSIIGLLGVFFALGIIGLLLGIVAVVLVAVSKDEFNF